mmetsp:Transcript_15956/g.37629  ORF Transcript_15956/g.37629 Transcript_15956/m.37629 type:complete len:884 (+) Transcript_15956:123-2774(+)
MRRTVGARMPKGAKGRNQQAGVVVEREAARQAAAQPDMVQLTALTAAASSAASNMAFAIDAVVKEASMFFGAMPSAKVRRPGPDAREISEEVFRDYEKRIHTDACSAAEACAEVHQWAARDRDSATKDAARSMQAAMAAGCVGNLAQRTATTVREVAQLCMLILEEAVQANAGPMAREAAKRCAEQALRSVEAAAIAEQHSSALQELLSPVLRIYEQERRAVLAASPSQTSRRNDGVLAWGMAPATQSIASPPVQTPLQSSCVILEEAPQNASSTASDSAMRSSIERRWWDEVPALPRKAARTRGPGESGNDQSEASSDLERRLREKATVCAAAAAEADGQTLEQRQTGLGPGAIEEDEMALTAILEWRFGLSLALQSAEEDVLSDVQVGQLALWRSTAGEGLPAELLEAMRQKGHDHADTLIAALQSATREAPQEPVPSKKDSTESAAPYVSPFRNQPVQEPPPVDWEQAFDKLHWVPNSSTSAQSSGSRSAWAAGQSVANNSAVASAVAASSGLLLANVDGDHAADLESTSDKDEGWDIDNMTLHTLHELSMKSRSKQRRVSVKGKGLGEDGAAAVQESAGGDNATPAGAAEESEENDLRQFLIEIFGESQLPVPDESGVASLPLAPPAAPAAGGKTTLSRNKKKKQTRAAASATTPAPASSPSAASAVPQAMPAKVTTTSTPPPPQGSTSVQTSAMEPVHRLIEPKELLSAAMGRQSGDYDELEDAQVEHDLPPRDSLTARFLRGRGLGLGVPQPMFPGQRQQRQAFTFHESMEHIAVQRREAYGVPPGLGDCSASSMRSPCHRARTFNEGFPDRASLPTTPVQGTFIRTPTWTSASSGEFGVAFKDDNIFSPLYVQPAVGSAVASMGAMAMEHTRPGQR